MTKYLLGASALLALTACPGSTKECDSGDSVCPGDSDTAISGCGTYSGDVYIDVDASLCESADASAAIAWDCDDDEVWWLDVYTVGWSAGGTWSFRQTGAANGWDEDHPVGEYDSDSDGWWTNLYIELTDVDDPGQVVEGSTSLYECNNERINSLTQIVAVEDGSGAEADCAAWGHDTSHSDASGCTVWN